MLSSAADDAEFQGQYDTVMKEVIVLDNSLVNKGQVTEEDFLGKPEEKTQVHVDIVILFNVPLRISLNIVIFCYVSLRIFQDSLILSNISLRIFI